MQGQSGEKNEQEMLDFSKNAEKNPLQTPGKRGKEGSAG